MSFNDHHQDHHQRHRHHHHHHALGCQVCVEVEVGVEALSVLPLIFIHIASLAPSRFVILAPLLVLLHPSHAPLRLHPHPPHRSHRHVPHLHICPLLVVLLTRSYSLSS